MVVILVSEGSSTEPACWNIEADHWNAEVDRWTARVAHWNVEAAHWNTEVNHLKHRRTAIGISKPLMEPPYNAENPQKPKKIN